MKKVLIFLVEDFEEIEAITVVDVMRRAGVQCDMCSVSDEYVTGSHGITVKVDVIMDCVEARDYDVVILPGGPGTENLRKNVRILEFVKDFYMSGRLTAAICAAPAVFADAGIINGHKVTSYPSVQNELKNSIYLEELVVEDGNLLTSRGPATSLPFSYAILKHLGLEEEAEALKEGMMYNFLKENQ
ncbi:DJ-1 family glyoxalase III [Clostridium oryzae]|uniref:Chaperone protein YajL n=1 Tax=Clostridium oryzae TaxID=1450648 RepID=A0A1V4IM02_9CLOT|nr:DJ-1 family glyoxalase III [Clostridium oryzae]OPJ60850.1 chaperone protein YajL [Clostridium oryzae]